MNVLEAFTAAGIALAVSILLTALQIRVAVRARPGPRQHRISTTGGGPIVVAIWLGYLLAHLIGRNPATEPALLLCTLTTLLGGVGLLDQALKQRRGHDHGLHRISKIAAQLLAASPVAVLLSRLPDADAPATIHTMLGNVMKPLTTATLGAAALAVIGICVWVNAVTLTDGPDGLTAGTCGLILGVYVAIGFWQHRNDCATAPAPGCYPVPAPLDLAVLACAGMGACIGFLWWNAAPARITMGPTGSLALGGLIAGLSIVTRTQTLLVVIGGVFVVEALSVVMQTAVHRTTRRTLFRTAPFHDHFELGGWALSTVTVRFWLLAGICAALGLALFYSNWLTATTNH